MRLGYQFICILGEVLLGLEERAFRHDECRSSFHRDQRQTAEGRAASMDTKNFNADSLIQTQFPCPVGS